MTSARRVPAAARSGDYRHSANQDTAQSGGSIGLGSFLVALWLGSLKFCVVLLARDNVAELVSCAVSENVIHRRNPSTNLSCSAPLPMILQNCAFVGISAGACVSDMRAYRVGA